MEFYYPEHNRFTSFSLPDGSDVLLHPGQIVEIPDEYAESEYIVRLRALQILIPPPPEEEAHDVAAPVPPVPSPKKTAPTDEVTK